MGGMKTMFNRYNIPKDDILVNAIKNHIKQDNGDFPNFDYILQAALSDKELNLPSRRHRYKDKVDEWLKQNYTSNGVPKNIITRSPTRGDEIPDDDWMSGDNLPYKSNGGSRRRKRHSRRRRVANKKSRKNRRSHKSRKSRKSRRHHRRR
jgi:hypothetical protein